jgi:serine/threonine protein phosphatase PrpC
MSAEIQHPEGENEPVGSRDRTGPPAPGRVAFPPPLAYDDPSIGSDPAGLPSAETAVPDTVLDGARIGGLTVRAASLRGDDHRYFGQTRQDALGIRAIPGDAPERADALVVCVADGLGSEPYSHLGAEAACWLVGEEIERDHRLLLDPGAQVSSIAHVLAGRLAQRLLEIARRSGLDPKAVRTTLVATLIETEPADPAYRRCVVLAVGDSPAFVLRDGAFRPCLDALTTAALPTGFHTVETAVVTLGPGDMLLLCSDGLSDPMRTAAVERDLAAHWSGTIPGLPEFCWQLGFRARSCGDDRTAICVWGEDR